MSLSNSIRGIKLDDAKSLYDEVVLPCDDSIRLLTVDVPQSDSESRPLKCRLFSVRLHDDANKYVALSYAWRAPLGETDRESEDERHGILCNGHHIQVLENLFHALHQLAQPSWMGTLFWIDALCINQQDREERASQVAMMGAIYSGAKHTVVWLGVDDGTLHLALSMIDFLSKIPNEKRKEIRRDHLHKSKRTKAVFLDRSEDQWRALTSFFKRAWFSRAWIVQEVLLSQSLQVLCGNTEVVWEDLVEASSFLASPGWAKLLTGLQHDDANRSGAAPKILEMYATLEGPAKLRAARRDLSKGHLHSFLHCLIRSRKYVCSDPRDKVYSLHAIAHSQGFPVPKPDYESSTTSDVYTKAAVDILTRSENLHILAHVEGRCTSDLSLPSWAPDWSNTEILGLAITGYERYRAAGTFTQTPVISADNRVLTLQATCIARISTIGESKESVGQFGPSRSFPGWMRVVKGLGSMYLDGQHILEAFWRTLIRDTDEDRNCPADDSNHRLGSSFRAWVAHLAYPEGIPLDKCLLDALCTLHPDLELHSRLQSLCSSNSALSDFLLERGDDQEAVFDLAYNYRVLLRLYSTVEGHLGLGADCLQEGDSIWVVPGSNVPLILRQKIDETTDTLSGLKYELVGGTYVHGVMKGEVLTREVMWQVIDIV